MTNTDFTVRESETSRTRNNFKTSIDNAIGWRNEKVIVYPGDGRNQNAVRHLTALLRSCDELSTDRIRAYQNIYDEFSYVTSSIESSMLRRIGFDYFPKSADEFVSDLVSNVSGSAE
jgi:hypothetical protein